MLQGDTTIHRQSATCRNCGHEAVERFCGRCGQENTHHVLPVSHLLHELLDEFVKWDSRLLRTLKALLTRPGFLTNEFLGGRRASYITPLRLYFTISTLYFLAFSFFSVKQVKNAFVMPGPTASVVADKAINAAAKKSPASAKGGEERRQAEAEHDRLKNKARKRVAEGGAWMVDHLATISICLIPGYAGILRLLFWRSKRLYMEHLVFLLHVHSFAFLVSLPTTIGQLMPVNFVVNVTIVPAYTFFAMRRVYKQGTGKTLLKTVLLTLAQFGLIFTTAILLTLLFVIR